MNLGNTIQEKNQASLLDCAKVMIFLHQHLDEGLKNEYLTIKDPLVLWKNLKERYDHQKTFILPKARYDWMHLRLQDLRIVAEYNSSLFKISSKLQLCEEKKSLNQICWKKHTPHFTHRMCSCSSNIKSVGLQNIMN